MEGRETPQMRKYGESKTTRIMMATVPHVTSGSGLIFVGQCVQERKVKFNGMANIELLSGNAHITTYVAYTLLPNTFIYWNQRTIYSVARNQRHVKEKYE